MAGIIQPYHSYNPFQIKPGLDREIAQQLVESAHQTCQYSKVNRGNVNVEINLV